MLVIKINPFYKDPVRKINERADGYNIENKISLQFKI
jgi:hypothetical protein